VHGHEIIFHPLGCSRPFAPDPSTRKLGRTDRKCFVALFPVVWMLKTWIQNLAPSGIMLLFENRTQEIKSGDGEQSRAGRKAEIWLFWQDIIIGLSDRRLGEKPDNSLMRRCQEPLDCRVYDLGKVYPSFIGANFISWWVLFSCLTANLPSVDCGVRLSRERIILSECRDCWIRSGKKFADSVAGEKYVGSVIVHRCF